MTSLRTWSDKKLSVTGPIRFMFVGSSFFRKGGWEILKVFEEFASSGADIELVVVSSLAVDPHISVEDEAGLDKAYRMLFGKREWLKFYQSLPNETVLQLMRSTHVGLLPTRADTYGYSLLEFQASGCPVISTDVRALPEINDDTRGWMINVPKNRFGEAVRTTRRERQTLSDSIIDGLKHFVEDILNDPAVIPARADLCIERIRSQHCPIRHAARIQEIYDDSMRECRSGTFNLKQTQPYGCV